MILEFLPEASAELFEAAVYYESKQEGLGRRFRNEVLEVCGLIKVCGLIIQQPLLWRERPGGYRRVNCRFSLIISLTSSAETLLSLQRLPTATDVRDIGSKDRPRNN